MRRICYALIAAFMTVLITEVSHAQSEINELTERAQKGNAQAQYLLGMYFQGEYLRDGTSVHKDPVLTEKWLRMSAEQGFLAAQFFLGELYYEGYFIERNKSQAERWLSKVYESGGLDKYTTAKIQFMRGMLYYQECDPRYLRISCGTFGNGLLPKDYRRASQFLHDAAESGYGEALFMLGSMYQTGIGVPQDYSEATKWYKLAVEAGAEKACGYLAKASLLAGDYVSAHEWFNLTAAEGDNSAANSRDEVAKLMTAAQVVTAQQLAREVSTKHSPARVCF
jgi:uncharacterized protein